jgi:F-type H+-transporting ATPase subunit epsilon
MPVTSLQLKVLLPFQVFADVTGVTQLVVETAGGSFGLLPQRLDCVAALVPGILSYQTAADGEVFLAVDEGVLVKTADQVLISVRRALRGSDLDQLRAAVEEEFLSLNAEQQSVRAVMAKLESGFLQRFVAFQQEQGK